MLYGRDVYNYFRSWSFPFLFSVFGLWANENDSMKYLQSLFHR